MGNKFDPNEYMMDMRGKDYLPVAPRLAWVNDDQATNNLPSSEHGSIEIETEMLRYGQITTRDRLGKESSDYEAVFTATITIRDRSGAIVRRTRGHKRETMTGFADFVEKAETGAIGRALAAAGYGTIQSLDFEEGEKASPIDGKVGPAVVDAPYALPTPAAAAAGKKGPSKRSGKTEELPAPTPPPAVTPLSVPIRNTPSEEAPRPFVAPASREEMFEWLKEKFGDPRVSLLLHEATKKHGVERVGELTDGQLSEAYEAAQAFYNN
jgi:hypothetical protein